MRAMISRVVNQEWGSRGECLHLLQGRGEVAELVPVDNGAWIWRLRGSTAKGLHGKRFADLAGAQAAVSAHFEAEFVAWLSEPARTALSAAGLLQ
jgi:hypothetical protein